MKLLVCFKVVPDLTMLPSSDWHINDQCRVDTSFLRTIINPYDESALEFALRFRDEAQKMGEPISLHALTLGDHKADSTLKTLLALRFESATRLATDDDLIFNSERVADIIECYLKKSDQPDIILFGRQSAEGNNGKTPFLMAENLKWPCINEVIALSLNPEKHLTTVSQIKGYTLEQTVCSPVILAIGETLYPKLRTPTLKDRMTHGKSNIHTLNISALGFEKDAAVSIGHEPVSMKVVRHERATNFIEIGSAEEIAKTLYHDYLEERLKQL